jgi:hypothetical protein
MYVHTEIEHANRLMLNPSMPDNATCLHERINRICAMHGHVDLHVGSAPATVHSILQAREPSRHVCAAVRTLSVLGHNKLEP